MPGLAGIAVPLALAVLVCLPLAGRRLSVVRLGLSVVASQALFHTLFVLGASAPAGSSTTGSPAGGHAMHGGHHLTLADVAPAASSLSATAMWASHVIAAVVTIAALHYGERVLEKIAALRARIWATLLPTIARLAPVSFARPVRVVVRALPFVVHRRPADDVAPLRGPPAAVA